MNALTKLAQAALAEQWPRREVEMVAVELPLPISTNDLSGPSASGGIIKTPRYRVWARHAANMIGHQQPGRVSGSYQLTLLINPRRTKMDLDNACKAAADALQTAGVIENDKFAARIVLEWSNEVQGMRAIVEKWRGQARAA